MDFHRQKFFENCLNEFYHIITERFFVHGDHSPRIFLQGMRALRDMIQLRRFSLDEATASEISFRQTVDVMRRDLFTLCRFFKRRYRLLPDTDVIVSEFISAFR